MESMDNSTLNPDEARERLAAWKGRIDKLAADTKEMSDRYQQLEVTASDPRGMARVTVDSSGSLIGLRLTREIEKASPDEVASTIMRTIRAAKTELADRSEEIIAETVGTESPAARAIASRVGEQLRRGAEDDELEEAAEPAPAEPEQEDPSGQGPLQQDPLRAAGPPRRPAPRVERPDDGDDTDETIWR
jgi:DNA-binding protein YbaB